LFKIRDLSLVFLLAACAPTPQKLADSDPGPYPGNHQALVRDWLAKNVGAYYSIRDLKITEPQKGAYFRGVGGGANYEYAYYSCATFTAKSKTGNYKGLTVYNVYLKNDGVIRATVSDTNQCESVQHPTLDR
jgi:hypothetical protein